MMCQKLRKENGASNNKQEHSGIDGWINVEYITEWWLVAFQLVQQIVNAAHSGQILPQLTLCFLAHLAFHLGFFSAVPTTIFGPASSLEWLKMFSLAVLALSACFNICGYIVLTALYRHSVQTIFNRSLPSSLLECIPSFGAHMALLKPLEIMFRYATSRFRVLPDIIVLGEVRCGTTTLCQHLSSMQGCQPPFCLWKHPELDHKESFYFVGHYLGHVDPFYYRMCFPLALTKWFREHVLRQAFFTFDGCAQYLTNPVVPHLIAKTYHDAGQPPPVLVACVRDPVDQAVSWWRYENNAMLWGESMGLTQWNTELRSPAYPPMTISGALDFSMSETVEEAYRMTEDLFPRRGKVQDKAFVLPPWAMTWPGGQLSGIGRNGRFASNIMRFERAFDEAFGCRQNAAVELVPATSSLKNINVVPLEFLENDEKLNSTLTSLMNQVDQRLGGSVITSLSNLSASHQIRRNSSALLRQNSYPEPTQLDTKRLGLFFSKDVIELCKLTGLEL